MPQCGSRIPAWRQFGRERSLTGRVVSAAYFSPPPGSFLTIFFTSAGRMVKIPSVSPSIVSGTAGGPAATPAAAGPVAVGRGGPHTAGAMARPPPLQPEYYTPQHHPQPPAGMAVASLVCGIASLPMLFVCYVGIPLAIVAVVLGIIARRQARRGVAGGQGMATAGVICGGVTLALVGVFIGVVVVFAVMNHH